MAEKNEKISNIMESAMLSQGFSLYDIHRKPMPLTDCNEISVGNLDLARDELKCVICQETLRDPVLFLECLHRFCRECIRTSLRNTSKHCPSCRTACGTHRSLRDDTELAALISALFPDLEDRIDRESKEIEDYNRENYMNDDLSRERAERLKRQSLALRRHSSNGNLNAKRQKSNNSSTLSQRIVDLKEGRESYINFLLRLHPGEKRLGKLSKELLRTPGRCTILRMKRFLSDKMGHTPFTDFEILVLFPVLSESLDIHKKCRPSELEYSVEDSVILDDSDTIVNTIQKHWGTNVTCGISLDLVLHFRLKEEKIEMTM